LLQDGDIVVSRAGSVGYSHLIRNPEEAIFASYLIRFKPLINLDYVALFLKSPLYWEAISEKSAGIAIPNVNATKLRQIDFPLPPLPEQHRIVEAIETQFTRLDAAVAALERAQANLARSRASVLQAACEGRLVPTEEDLARREGRDYEPADALLARILEERRAKWEAERWDYEIERAQKKAAQAERKAAGLPYRIRDLEPEHWQNRVHEEYAPYLPKGDKWKRKYDEPAPPDTEGLPELPEGWVWTLIEQIGDILGGLTKNSKRKLYPLQIPYLRVANVYADELRLDEIKQIGVEESELNRVLLEKNDLLVVEGNGSIDQIGRVAIWNGSIAPCVHQNHLIKVRLLLPQMAKYVLNWLLSVGGRENITKVASSTSGLYTLSLSKVSSLPVPLPPSPSNAASWRRWSGGCPSSMNWSGRSRPTWPARRACGRPSSNRHSRGAWCPRTPTTNRRRPCWPASRRSGRRNAQQAPL